MRRAALVLAVAALAAACDSGPSGPGTWAATVEAPATIGAVVLEFNGGGIEGFESAGSTRAFGATLSQAEGRHRVVLVSTDASPMRFGIRVQDVGADKPTVTVVSAASTDNLPTIATGISVRIER